MPTLRQGWLRVWHRVADNHADCCQSAQRSLTVGSLASQGLNSQSQEPHYRGLKGSIHSNNLFWGIELLTQSEKYVLNNIEQKKACGSFNAVGVLVLYWAFNHSITPWDKLPPIESRTQALSEPCMKCNWSICLRFNVLVISQHLDEWKRKGTC